MYEAKVENQYGKTLNLTQNPNYDVLKIDGLTPPDALLIMNEISNFDGSIYNGSRLSNRNIVITIKPNFPVERNRLAIYEYFRIKSQVKFSFKNDARDVYIYGYVESIDGDLFEFNQTLQISIICNDPYFKESSVTTLDFISVESLFEFPFSISEEGIEFSRIIITSQHVVNGSNFDNGLIIEMHALADNIVNPMFYNLTTNTFLGLNYVLNAGDTVVINTNKGHKSVILIRDGQKINLINYLKPFSAWIQIIAGDNELSYSSDSGADELSVNVTYENKFEGV